MNTPFGHMIIMFTDKMKDAMVAKVAMQASDLFADAANNMQVGQVKSLWEKVWQLGSCDLDLVLCVIYRVGLILWLLSNITIMD